MSEPANPEQLALRENYMAVQSQIAQAGGPHASVQLVAVSKMQTAAAVRDLATLGQRTFGENYVQEALEKQRSLRDLALEWHLIGPLQSNKCALVAQHFDWLQTLDRAKLIPLLAAARRPDQAPLQVLIQVNIDDESAKSGCKPEEILGLASALAPHTTLKLRGLMCIPKPDGGKASFIAMRTLFAALQRQHGAQIDRLSMGMSGDFAQAIACGANCVRVGSALFGARRAEPQKNLR